MPNYFASDLDVFFDTMGGGEVDVESSQPVFYSKASNLSSASHGDSMVINSVTYKIINIRPDETGMIEVVLEKQ